MRRRVIRAGGLLLLPTLATAALLSLPDRPVPHLPVGTSQPCRTPPVFQAASGQPAGVLQKTDAGWRFRGNSWVEGVVCTPGTLQLTVQGDQGGAERPRLTIVQGADLLAALDVGAASQAVRVRVPRTGPVVMAYLNDAYQADVRVARVRVVRLQGAECAAVTVGTVPAEAGAAWNPVTQVATVVRGPPLTLLPCGAGQLTVALQGQAGGGVFPVVELTATGHPAVSLSTRAEWQSLTVPVGAGAVGVRVVNPYGRVLLDRNLTVSSLTFVPDR